MVFQEKKKWGNRRRRKKSKCFLFLFLFCFVLFLFCFCFCFVFVCLFPAISLAGIHIPGDVTHLRLNQKRLPTCATSTAEILGQLRPFFWVNCAHFVKSWRLSTVILIYMNYNFLICHILWHFQDGRHWPWKFHMGQKLKHALISLKIVSNCLSCHKDSKNV